MCVCIYVHMYIYTHSRVHIRSGAAHVLAPLVPMMANILCIMPTKKRANQNEYSASVRQYVYIHWAYL